MNTRRTALPVIIALTAAVLAAGQAAGSVPEDGASSDPHALPLGPAGLTETRTTRTIQPGVTLTTIVRGVADPDSVWTVEIAIPSGEGSPDPDAPPAALKDEAAANATADQLRAAGLEPRVEPVPTPRVADAGGGVLGYRVRVGAVPTKAEADALRTQVLATGLGGSSIFTGWDGEPDDVSGSTGPWQVRVLTVDPRRFSGTLAASYGPDLERRETTSALAALTGATAAVNAGFFVLDPAAGAPGDPAGVAAYDGRLVSEPVAGRPALTVRHDARGTEVVRLRWRGTAGSAPAGRPEPGARPDPQLRWPRRHPDGSAVARRDLHRPWRADRVRLRRSARRPRRVRVLRSCSTGRIAWSRSETPGAASYRPVAGRSRRPATWWTTCARRPDPAPRSRSVPGWSTTTATGWTSAGRRRWSTAGRSWSAMAGCTRLPVRTGWRRPGTRASTTAGRTSGTRARSPVWTRPAGPCWSPPTDAVTASLGLGIAETAAVAKALGLRDALNLDGGGSTTMVVEGSVVNTPSDAAGERPIGDALIVLAEDNQK